MTRPAKIEHVPGHTNFSTFSKFVYPLLYGVAIQFLKLVYSSSGFIIKVAQHKCCHVVSILRYDTLSYME